MECRCAIANWIESQDSAVVPTLFGVKNMKNHLESLATKRLANLLQVNHQLTHQIAEFQQREAELQQINQSLQAKLAEQTATLQQLQNSLATQSSFYRWAEKLTDRQSAEFALRLSEERYRCLVSATAQVVWVSDADGQNTSVLNSHHLIEDENDSLGSTWFESIHPEDRNPVVAKMTQAMTAKTAYEIEFRFRVKDGTYRYFLSRGVPVLAEDGTVREWVGTSTDIHDRKQAEAQLQEREQFLQTIYDGATGLIVVVDVQDQSTFTLAGWNCNAEKVFGLSSAAVTGKTPEEIFGVLRGAELHQNYLTCLEMERPITHEEYIASANVDFWGLTTYNPLKNDQGQVYRIISTTIDISDRKRAEEALHQSEARNQAFLKAIPDLMFRIHEDGTFLDCNIPRGFQTLMPAGSLIGSKFQDALSPELSRQRFFYIQKAIGTRETQTFEYQIEVDGQLLYEEGRVAAINDHEVLMIIRDISDRKRAEQALKQSEERFQAFMRHCPAAWMTDSEGEILYVNETYLKTFQLPTLELVGKSIFDIYPEAVAQHFLENIRSVSNSHQVTEIVESAPGLDGLIHHFWVYKFPVSGKPGQTLVGGLAIDITERLQAEAQIRERTEQLEQTLKELQQTQTQLVQSEKMSSLGQLVAGVAHEINNPVNFIYGNLNHANDYIQDLLGLVDLYQKYYPQPHPEVQTEIESIDLEFLMDDLPKLLVSMKTGADRIQKIVRSLRNFSRMDEAEFKSVDLHEGLDSTLLILQHRLKERPGNPAIEVKKNYGSLPLVECYAGQMNQVFMNIITNAIDALEERDRQRSLEEIKQNPSQILISTQVQSGWIQIRIADNGVGIPESIQQRLFDPFFTTKPIGQGTGLGMSISYQIVTQKHQGRLHCYSQLGAGAEFMIEIPLMQSQTYN